MRMRLAALFVGIAALQGAALPPPAHAGGNALIAFKSDTELSAYLSKLKEQARRRPLAYLAIASSAVGDAAPAPAAMESLSLTAQRSEGESITNTQHADVDEGGIVKLHGDHLVMLRRGRLFSLAIGHGALDPISTVDAYGPGMDPNGTWYDELLVSDDTVVVIGFSYARGGTEIGLFDIDSTGRLAYRSTHHFRSNDYYSSRNYASRLIGSKLILYAPLDLNGSSGGPLDVLPAVRKWHEGARPEEFRRIALAGQVYRPNAPWRRYDNPVLHSVTTCDLSQRELDCHAKGVLGDWGRVFYVSPTSVYVWASQGNGRDNAASDSMLLRLPLDGALPNAIGVAGNPVDQFSFSETAQVLNVLVASNSQGDAMWGAEHSRGEMALLKLPLAIFGDGSRMAASWRYRTLPSPSGGAFQNRFVGDYLLYGSGNGWDGNEIRHSSLFVANTLTEDTTTLSLPHSVERIETMGKDAVVVGGDGSNLHFSGIRLGEKSALAQHFVLRNATQGEQRSHGFFYKVGPAGSGLLGLPVRGPAEPGYRHLVDESASIVFLRNDGRRFVELGELRGRTQGIRDDLCKVSCVDWYGNSRPLFIQGRILALMGYEIVEGDLGKDSLREQRRVNFSPSGGRLTHAVAP